MHVFLLTILSLLVIMARVASGVRGLDVGYSVITVKMAIFVDDSMSKHLKENLKFNETESNRFLAAYMAQVQAIFRNLARESRVFIKLEVIGTRFPVKRGNHSSDGDIDELLSDFCLYQAKQRHTAKTPWDLALMMTATDLYSSSETLQGSKQASESTLGISPINGIEWPDLSCIIVEFGVGFESATLVDSKEHRVYPTRGFASAWVAAHEIAHNIGIYHDGSPFNADCDDTKFIMSPRNYLDNVPTQWSSCSVESVRRLNLRLSSRSITNSVELRRLEVQPGQQFDAHSQCKIFSKILDVGSASINSSICRTLRCTTKSSQVPVTIGPALEGTSCGPDMACIQGVCTNTKDHHQGV